MARTCTRPPRRGAARSSLLLALLLLWTPAAPVAATGGELDAPPSRAAEAEALAARLNDRRREMLQQIAYLWREVAQHALLDDMRSREP